MSDGRSDADRLLGEGRVCRAPPSVFPVMYIHPGGVFQPVRESRGHPEHRPAPRSLADSHPCGRVWGPSGLCRPTSQLDLLGRKELSLPHQVFTNPVISFRQQGLVGVYITPGLQPNSIIDRLQSVPASTTGSAFGWAPGCFQQCPSLSSTSRLLVPRDVPASAQHQPVLLRSLLSYARKRCLKARIGVPGWGARGAWTLVSLSKGLKHARA